MFASTTVAVVVADAVVVAAVVVVDAVAGAAVAEPACQLPG